MMSLLTALLLAADVPLNWNAVGVVAACAWCGLLLALGLAASPRVASTRKGRLRVSARSKNTLAVLLLMAANYAVRADAPLVVSNDVTAAIFTGDVGEGVAPGRNSHILWDAGADRPDRKGDVKAIITSTKRDLKQKSVQLWAGGPYWADRNIGASSPEDAGLYFWWGDTTGHRPSGTTFSFPFFPSNTPTYNKTPATLQSEGWVVSKKGTCVLAPAHDAAHVKWGGSWRMPTYQELYDLCSTYCDWTWTTRNGVRGYIVRGRGSYAANSIFLPASGYGYGTSLRYSGSDGGCWSSVPDSDYTGTRYLYFSSGYHSTSFSLYRNNGFPVRPVQGSTTDSSAGAAASAAGSSAWLRL